MKSKIMRALQTRYAPVAILFTSQKPQGALSFQENRYGCVAAMLQAATKGKTVAFSRKTFGCPGGGVGLGFGNCYRDFPGSIENFLSTGNPQFCETDIGKRVVQEMPQIKDGERYLKNSTIAAAMVKSLPIQDIGKEYVVFQPLAEVDENYLPQNVIFFVNADQLTALVVLASYGRTDYNNVIAPFGSACQQIGILAYKEGEKEQPRAIIGLTDITIRRLFDPDILSFTVPYKMYLEMEKNVAESFLEGNEWKNIVKRNRE